jgi:hypothetical protein
MRRKGISVLYTIYVAICVASMNPTQCDRHTAVDWIPAPEQAEGLSMCAQTGYEFAAESNLVREGTYPKIFCSVGAGAPRPDDLT